MEVCRSALNSRKCAKVGRVLVVEWQRVHTNCDEVQESAPNELQRTAFVCLCVPLTATAI